MGLERHGLCFAASCPWHPISLTLLPYNLQGSDPASAPRWLALQLPGAALARHSGMKHASCLADFSASSAFSVCRRWP